MVHGILYSLNIVALLLGLRVFSLAEGEKRFSLALVQTMFCLPLLICEYVYLAADMESDTLQLVLFSEIIFGLVWLSMTMNLHRATDTIVSVSRRHLLGETIIGGMAAVAAGYFLALRPVEYIVSSKWAFAMYSPAYFSAILLLLIILYGSWRLEQFWQSLNAAQRWEYKFLILGSALVSGSFAWCASYRLTYLNMEPRHLHLLAALLFLGWILISYAVVSHRLLNRKIFISRKIIYSSFAPAVLAAYFLGFGVVVLIAHRFELELSYVLKWLMLITTLMLTIVVITSGKLRRRLQFYISTHFYINKYEYRDEWLALSEQLQGASTELEVVHALRHVLDSCLYTRQIFIWLDDGESSTMRGYRRVDFFDSCDWMTSNALAIASDDPLTEYLRKMRFFTFYEEQADPLWHEVVKEKGPFLSALNLKLLAPIAIGTHLVGIIGLGPEYTGGEYGHDDFDLLKALGSQTASALLAVRTAEELARAREQQAWNRLSAFVLHDIKNAATMLGLLRENAPAHMHEPEFQKDMLELVDDALKRMGRVEERLRSLQDEVRPRWQNMELGAFLDDCSRLMRKKLPGLKIAVDCPKKIWLKSDPALLTVVLENLLLNSVEAGGGEARVQMEGCVDDNGLVRFTLLDNGPGIANDLLPDRLFEPFKTGKEGGSGIGLWQVKRNVHCLGGTILAENVQDYGASFRILLPIGGFSS